MVLEIKNWLSGRATLVKPERAIVLLLHGYGSNEEDLPGLMLHLPDTLPWYSLRAPVDLGNGFFAWANRVTPGNPPADDVELATDAIWRWVDGNLSAKTPLIILGFSQGGLMATQLLRTRPDRIAGTVILAGFTLDAAQPADSLLVTEKPKIIYCRGLQDEVISRDAVQRTLTWLKAHTTADIHSYDGLGHSIDERVMEDVADYLKSVLSV